MIVPLLAEPLPTGRHTYEGELGVLRIRKRSRRRGLLNAMLDEAAHPAFYQPSFHLYLTDLPQVHGHIRAIRMTSLPKGLEECCAGPIARTFEGGHRVRITVTVKPFANGLGGDGIRAVGECLEDHSVVPLNHWEPPDPKQEVARVFGAVSEAVKVAKGLVP
jgi:hypothetical protein